MGYCPLGRLKMIGKSCLVQEADRLKITEPQLAIRWSLEKGFVTIPKSTNAERIAQNGSVLGLPALDEQSWDALQRAECGFKASSSVNAMNLPWDEVK